MNHYIQTLTQKIHALELQLEAEVAKRHAELRFGLKRGRIKFEEEVRQRHKELKTHLLRYVLNARPLVVELCPEVGDGGNREGGISWGCLTPPLLHRRSDMPCLTITSSD